MIMKLYLVKCIACYEDDEYGHEILQYSHFDVFTDKFEAEFAIEEFKDELKRIGCLWHSHISTFEIEEKEI